MNIFLIQLAIVFLPGLIWAQLDGRYAMKEKPQQVEFLIKAFMFGLTTYAFVYIGYELSGHNFSSLPISESNPTRFLMDEFIDEILISLPTAFILAVIWIYAATYKWLTLLLQKIRATKKYGDEDVWDFTFNSPRAEVEYVHVRDFNKGITYAGWVAAFSESGKLRELLLRDAIIHDNQEKEIGNSTGNEPGIPYVYIARDVSDIDIEFPYRKQKQLSE